MKYILHLFFSLCSTFYTCPFHYAVRFTSVLFIMQYVLHLYFSLCSTFYICTFQYAVHSTSVLSSKQHIIHLSIYKCSLTPMGVLDPGPAHARPSPRTPWHPFDMSGHFAFQNKPFSTQKSHSVWES